MSISRKIWIIACAFLSLVLVNPEQSHADQDFIQVENIEWFDSIEPAAGGASLGVMPDRLLSLMHGVTGGGAQVLLPPTIDSTPEWIKQSVAYQPDGKKPIIAIVIDDMGVVRSKSDQVVALPAPLTLAYLPYADNLADQTGKAKRSGHELLVHMPMEPSSPVPNPGPNALRVSLSKAELYNNLTKNLDAFEGYVGINNHMGSKMTKDRKALSIVMKELNKRSLLYLDSRTTALSVAETTAQEYGVTTTHRDVFLDHEMTQDFVESSLRKTERYAKKHGSAIAIGHPHDVTVEVLSKWLPKAKARGFEIVPLTTVVKYRNDQAEEQAKPIKAAMN